MTDNSDDTTEQPTRPTPVDDRGPSDDSDDGTGDLPPAVVDEAERLTHLAREAVVDAEAEAYRADRDDRLAEYGYTARIREDDTRDVLVLHPEEWVEDGVVQTDRIDDTDRGVELPLSGPGEGDDWAEIDAHNSAIADRVADAHGEVHGRNAEAFAEFMSNHYAKPLEQATPDERTEFLTDYYPRNVWPTEEQEAVVEESVALAVEVGDSLTGAVR